MLFNGGHYQLMLKDNVVSNHRSLVTAGRAWFAYCKGKPGTFGHPELWIRDFSVEDHPDVTHQAHEALEKESMSKTSKKTKATTKRDLGWALCISTDGEVLVAKTTPDFQIYMPTWAEPPQAPFTKEQAVAIRNAICDHYPKEQGDDPAETGRWLFRSDPKTQIDLSRGFRAAVKREASKL